MPPQPTAGASAALRDKSLGRGPSRGPSRTRGAADPPGRSAPPDGQGVPVRPRGGTGASRHAAASETLPVRGRSRPTRCPWPRSPLHALPLDTASRPVPPVPADRRYRCMRVPPGLRRRTPTGLSALRRAQPMSSGSMRTRTGPLLLAAAGGQPGRLSLLASGRREPVRRPAGPVSARAPSAPRRRAPGRRGPARRLDPQGHRPQHLGVRGQVDARQEARDGLGRPHHGRHARDRWKAQLGPLRQLPLRAPPIPPHDACTGRRVGPRPPRPCRPRSAPARATPRPSSAAARPPRPQVGAAPAGPSRPAAGRPRTRRRRRARRRGCTPPGRAGPARTPGCGRAPTSVPVPREGPSQLLAVRRAPTTVARSRADPQAAQRQSDSSRPHHVHRSARCSGASGVLRSACTGRARGTARTPAAARSRAACTCAEDRARLQSLPHRLPGQRRQAGGACGLVPRQFGVAHGPDERSGGPYLLSQAGAWPNRSRRAAPPPRSW